MDQGRLGSDQVNAVVVSLVRSKHRPAPSSCARLQSRQLPANTGDARAGQRLVAEESGGEADQDRSKGGESRTLSPSRWRRSPSPTANVPGEFAAHRGTTAAATTSASVRRHGASSICRSIIEQHGQGNRVKKSCRDQTCEEVIVPCCHLASQTQTISARSFSDQIMRNVLEGGEVGGSVISADAAFVVTKNHIHHPM
jgi:hypothetical protein